MRSSFELQRFKKDRLNFKNWKNEKALFSDQEEVA